MKEKVRVLFVDDEQNILNALRRAFRKEPWEMSFALSGPEALKKFEQEGPYDVVVTDHRMPRMTGVQLLKTLRVRHPRTVRIILSSYTEVGTLLDAINEGYAYKFLDKACSEAVIRQTIEEVAEAVALRAENERLANQLEAQHAEISAVEWLVEELDSCDFDMVALEASNGHLVEAAVNAMPVAVLVLGKDGDVALANPEAIRLLASNGSQDLTGDEWQERLRNRAGLSVKEAPVNDGSGDGGKVYVFWEV
jgi:DNA-binding NtrC family response regulator